MKYLMFVATDPEAPEEPDLTGVDTIEEWGDWVEASGSHVIGDRLRPAEDATTVRRRGGKLLVTDGPYAGSGDCIAGFDILDCADLDEAIEIAGRHPMAAAGRLELRPFWPLDGSEG